MQVSGTFLDNGNGKRETSQWMMSEKIRGTSTPDSEKKGYTDS
jgi:hypothetical protein